MPVVKVTAEQTKLPPVIKIGKKVFKVKKP
jgi:hypothetical protein